MRHSWTIAKIIWTHEHRSYRANCLPCQPRDRKCGLESNLSTRARYHAVAEEGVPAREIAEAIGRGLKIPVVSMSPEEAAGHFGWLGFFAGMDMPASSALTQQRLGWRPTQKAGMIDDLDHMNWSGG
jgi:hypothetical protein